MSHSHWRPGVRESIGLSDEEYYGTGDSGSQSDNLDSLKRGELDKIAASKGLEPKDYANKTLLIEAIRAA